MTKPVNRALWGLCAFLSVGVAIVSYRYLAPAAAPTLAPEILANLFAKPWLNIHIAGAATALLLGPFQFLSGLREKHWQLHRWMGRVYVVSCIVGGIGGFIMAFGSTAGPIATVGFATLSICWVTANVQAWRMVLARRFAEHRAWMIRSFAMTFAAVNLRIYVLLLPLTGLTDLQSYIATAWISWIPNLILVELYMRGAFRRHAPPTAYNPSNSAVDT